MAALAMLFAGFNPLRGDVVTTYDGRVFEGTVLAAEPGLVRVDAMVGRIRATVTLRQHQVKTIEKKSLPGDFYVIRPYGTEEAGSDVPEPQGDLYLEVPIVGRFGVQVIPDGVRAALASAVRRKIKHIVFYLDSQGGDQIAASEIYDLLKAYDKRLQYHAIVRDAVGVATAVPIWCENVFMLPGSNLGGVSLIFDKEKDRGDPEVLLSQVAFEVSLEAKKKGWPAEVVRAMIDPSVSIGAWTTPEGKVVTGTRVPGTVSRNQIIFINSPGKVLTLSRSEATLLNIAKKFNGTAADLGNELRLSQWKSAGDSGTATMLKAVEDNQKRMARTATRNEAKIKRLVERRRKVERYIDRNLTLAHSWDPKQNARSTYSSHRSAWESRWGWGRQVGTTTSRRWRELTDMTLTALTAARKGIREMQKIEKEAESLGLERLTKEQDLEKLLDDTEVKMRMLLYWRGRATSAA